MKPIAPNTLIQNRYLIVHLIGKGGMGEVYLAIDQRLGSAVALKRTFFSDDELFGNAFEREARTLARLRHSVLTKVSDHFIEDETQYLVMEHIAGDDLAKRMEISKKPFPLSWVLFWADQLLDGLNYLHTHEPPIIHRDIKPQNLKLTNENNIVLLDFGLSKNNLGQTRISTSGSVVGYTPHYAPMEQIRGAGTDGRSDIFSLSATLYQLLTTVVPADSLTRADAVLSGQNDPLQPLSELNPKVPKDVSDVVLKGMALRQDQRFATAREMQTTLRDVYARSKNQTPAPTPTEDVQNRVEAPQSQSDAQIVSDSASVGDPAQTKARTGDSAANAHSASSELNSFSAQARGYQTSAPDFDATVLYDKEPKNFEADQANTKTEFFNNDFSESPASTREEDDLARLETISENNDFSNDQNFAGTENFDVKNDFESDENFSLDGAAPSASYETWTGKETSTSSSSPFETLSSSEEDQSPMTNNSAAIYSQPARSHSAPTDNFVPHAPSSGRTPMIAVALGALFILILGALGIGWYLSRASRSVTETPAATPEKTIEVAPISPSQAITETNSNVINVENAANTNARQEIVRQTEENKVDKTQTSQSSPAKLAATKTAGQTATVKTPSKSAEKVPAAKKTPAKNNRTAILQ